MDRSTRNNIIRNVNKLFIISMLIPCAVLIAGFVYFFAVINTKADIDDAALKKYIVAAVIFGVVSLLGAVGVFAVNSKKYSFLSDLGQFEKRRVVTIDSLAMSVGMVAPAVTIFYMLISGTLAVLNGAAETDVGYSLYTPVYAMVFVFMPCLLPTFLTERKVKLVLSGK